MSSPALGMDRFAKTRQVVTMPISEKVLRLAEAYASLSPAERSEFARLVTAADDGSDPEGLGAAWTRTIRHPAA